ncbi:MAG: D-2-hydroxyacid dehydrogenase, partial [Bryobacteraceae bacterium]
MPGLTLLVIGDPAAGFLRPLDRLPRDVRVIVSDDRERLGESAPEADVILQAGFSDRTLLRHVFHHASARLKWIHIVAAGVEQSLTPEIVESSVPVTNGRGLWQRPLAEWAIGAMIYFTYDFRQLIRNQEAGRWEQFVHPELHGQNLTVVGYGSIGREIAMLARGFNMRISAVRRNPAPDPLLDACFTPAQIDEAVSQADFIAVSSPLTKETRGLIGEAQIASMKDSAVIVNVGRGAVVDEPALISALEHKRIRGAALDVFAKEPLHEGHPFYKLDNVLLSPHIADKVPGKRA